MLGQKLKTYIVGGGGLSGGPLGGGNPLSERLKILRKAMLAISNKHNHLEGEAVFLGKETTDLTDCERGDGFYKHFAGGSIFWKTYTPRAFEVHGAIREKWKSMGWEKSFLGFPITDELTTPDGQGRYNHFEGGSIYWSPSTGAFEVHGAIRDKWASLGWESSFLGYPISDEESFDEGGRISGFQHGAIYWWPDEGAIELRSIIVQYTGINCFGETDEFSASDEPYVVFGIITGKGTSATRTRVYENVDSGESQIDLIQLYKGKARGLTISVLLMEHDEGDPNKYRDLVKTAVDKAFDAVKTVLPLIPYVGPILAVIGPPVLDAIAPEVTNVINEGIDTGDNRIGDTTIYLTPKQMVLLAVRTDAVWERGVSYKVATPLLSGEGGTYKAYFNLVPA